jgi:nucleosome binding factor SPN SPT16 subunit
LGQAQKRVKGVHPTLIMMFELTAYGHPQVDFDHAEFAYPPIIISRSTKTGSELKYTAESSKDNIAHKGVVLIACGMRYKSYCANAVRTFIVDPSVVWRLIEIDNMSSDASQEQEAQYNLLLSLQEEMLSFIKAGISVRDLYQHAVSYVTEKKPELEKDFVKNIGFAVSLCYS